MPIVPRNPSSYDYNDDNKFAYTGILGIYLDKGALVPRPCREISMKLPLLELLYIYIYIYIYIQNNIKLLLYIYILIYRSRLSSILKVKVYTLFIYNIYIDYQMISIYIS